MGSLLLLSVLALGLQAAPDASSPLEQLEVLTQRPAGEALDELSALAVSTYAAGDWAAARVILERTIERAEQADAPDGLLVNLQLYLGAVLLQLEATDEARDLYRSLLDQLDTAAPVNAEILRAVASNLALVYQRRGEFELARELQEDSLAELEAASANQESPALQTVRYNLSLTLKNTGDLERALALQTRALAGLEQNPGPDAPTTQRVRLGLASTLEKLGELHRARALRESVLAFRESYYPADHPDVLTARHNLAVSLRHAGDLPGARALLEGVLVLNEQRFSEDDPTLLANRIELAGVMWAAGDAAGARQLYEQVATIRERTLPPSNPHLQESRLTLATVLARFGELEAARRLQEQAIAALAEHFAEEHHDLLNARQALAATLTALGDVDGAAEIQQGVLERREGAFSDDHPDVQRARLRMAVIRRLQGQLPAARALAERAVAGLEAILPPDHGDLQAARWELAWILALAGEDDELGRVLTACEQDLVARLDSSLLLAPREASAALRSMDEAISSLLSLAPDRSQRRAFELIESARALSSANATLGRAMAADDQLRPLRERALALRATLNDLVAGIAGREQPDPTAIGDAIRARDAAERALRAALVAAGHAPPRIDLDAVADTLPDTAAVVSFRRYRATTLVPQAPGGVRGTESLLAFVARPDGSLQRVELGSLDAIDEAVEAWRDAIGKPIARGISLEEADGPDEGALGESLRKLVFDPVLAAAGDDATTLHLCLDDALHLVPLQALPFGDEPGSVLGDHYQFRHEVSLARLVAPPPPPPTEPSLVAFGGIDFDFDIARSGDNAELAAATAALPAELRAGPGGMAFIPLRQTRYEVEGIAELFENTFDKRVEERTRKRATKDALYELAPGTLYVHLATHGYFADESLRSAMDDDHGDAAWSRSSLADVVTGMAPMALCGLALAGANNGRDGYGRVPGIITAEELAGLDLSACRLAVLSACETNVGIRRAGQGIASLQTALHAAGARATITSLWKVDDQWTRDLMVDFYRRLWARGQSEADALWEAKRALRAEGVPTRDWAGWILTGSAGS